MYPSVLQTRIVLPNPFPFALLLFPEHSRTAGNGLGEILISQTHRSIRDFPFVRPQIAIVPRRAT